MINALDRLQTLFCLASKDWGLCSEDACAYGVIVGYDQASMKELAEKFKWTPERQQLLRDLHADFEKRMK